MHSTPAGRAPDLPPPTGRPAARCPAARADRVVRPPGRAGRPTVRDRHRAGPAGEDLAAGICRAVRAGDGHRVDVLLDRLERTADEDLLRRVVDAVRALDLRAE